MGGSGWHDRRWCARDEVEHHTTLRAGGVPRDLSEARWFSIMLQAADLEATDIAAFYFPLWLKPDRRVIPRGDAYWRFRTRRIRDRIRRRWNRDQVYQMGINISSCSDLIKPCGMGTSMRSLEPHSMQEVHTAPPVCAWNVRA